MQINVTFRHIEPSSPLKAYAEEKISRVKRFLEEPIKAHVVLKVEKHRHIAEVSIEANGLHVNSTEETGDLYSAIDALADTLEGQVKRCKDRCRRKVKDIPESFGEAMELDDDERRVIRVEQVYAKPMDVDEAVMQLTLATTNEFMVFTNRVTNCVNVLYRRKDGHFGLIETLG